MAKKKKELTNESLKALLSLKQLDIYWLNTNCKKVAMSQVTGAQRGMSNTATLDALAKEMDGYTADDIKARNKALTGKGITIHKK